ncbi:uncharacterized protein B0I36DRAFT_82731 [Microdochium trichocladiopsis]|uniref:Uncharacterized protein n=1 Tax=Microdochium trichocladiopsis TaxID=1682393 RepID=A0A9P8Y816_9PEZI|nr:uncharacterized protein B0I36DRAFT_82731 [Microdochium trichocladiopsis]KAH7034639.1 hypothetical protein B0I36DRAFT_82731 [Microdochium trichocladiopsis]
MPRSSTQVKPARAVGSKSRHSGIPRGVSQQSDILGAVEKLTIAGLTDDIPIANAQKPRPAAPQPFRFLDLPYELRVEVYKYHFANTGHVLDLDPLNYKRVHQKLAILRTCRTFYREASHCFYSTHPVRLFPTHPGRFFKTKKPLLARLKPGQRQSLTALELRLGPGWSKPPRGWVVNPDLGLADCTDVRKITVFVECDPGTDTFSGFRQPNEFFEGFAQSLLENVLKDMPWVDRVEFDAWSSVKKSGTLVQRLIEVAKSHHLKVTWGPERGWTDADEPEPRRVLNMYAPLPIASTDGRRNVVTTA